MAFIDQIEKVQGQALDTITDTQKRALEVNGKLAETLKDRVPNVKLPFTGVVPTPTEGVKLYFDFASKLLKANRTFAEEFVDAWDIASKPAAKPAAKMTATVTATVTVPQPAAKKPVAKKPVAKKAVAKKPVAKKSVAKKAAGARKAAA